MIDSDEIVRKNHLIVSQSAGEKMILLGIEDGQYYSLDEVGARVWELCDGFRTAAQLVSELMAEYDAPESAREELMEFLQELRESGLLIRSG